MATAKKRSNTDSATKVALATAAGGLLTVAGWQLVQRTRGRDPNRVRITGRIGLQTSLDLANWKLVLHTARGRLALSLDEIKTLPRFETEGNFDCIEGWKETFHYAGVRFSDFVEHYGIESTRYVGLATPDLSYYVSIDFESMLQPSTFLAYEMNGEPLSLEHGAPLRLIIPGKAANKSLKRVGHLWFSEVRPADYWAERGRDWFTGK